MDHCAICKEKINLKDLNTTLAMNDEKYMECWHAFLWVSISFQISKVLDDEM
jgi:hypothetical protein